MLIGSVPFRGIQRDPMEANKDINHAIAPACLFGSEITTRQWFEEMALLD